MQNRKRDTDVQNRLLDSVGEGEGGMFWENGIDPVNPHIKVDTRSITYKSTVILFRSVQLLRRLWLFVTPCTAACQGFPVHHQLLELSQTHGHWVGDAIQPSYLLSSPSPPAFNLTQHQGLFQWVSSSHLVSKVLELRSVSASVLPMNIQDWLPFGWTGWISLKSKGLSRVFSDTIVQKHQFFGTQLS